MPLASPLNPPERPDFNPVDPAFRARTQSQAPLPAPPSGLPIGQAPSIPGYPPTGNIPYPTQSGSPTSSDIKTSQAKPREAKNKFINLKEFPELEEIPEGDSETKKIITIGAFVIGGIFLTALILFFVTKSKQTKPPEEEPKTPTEEPTTPPTDDPTTPPTTPPTEEPTTPTQELPKETATQKHLSIPADGNVSRLLEDRFAEIKNQETEFIFYDQNNDQLSLARFSERAKITIPYYVNENITSKYYFFLNLTFSSKNPKAVLILESNFSNYKKTEEIMKRWESYLTEDLKSFILLGEDYDFIANARSKSFSSSSKYPGGRFINFLNDGSVSLNYIVMRDKILITNSFEAFESAIEYIKTREDL